MSKIRVAVYGTIGKCVYFDPQAGERAEAAVEALAQAISEGIGGTIQHRSLQGLQVGDDHPQYAMWQAPETIQGLWNFQTIPLIQGETLAEYIEDVVGQDFFDFLQDTSSVVWTYFDTDGELEANVPPEFVQDTVGAMLTNTSSINLTYSDPSGTFQADLVDEYVEDLVGTMLTNSASVFLDFGDSDGSISARVNTEWSPLWGQNHTWDDNAEVRLGAGGDLRLYHDGTDSFVRTDTGTLRLNIGTVTAARFTDNGPGCVFALQTDSFGAAYYATDRDDGQITFLGGAVGGGGEFGAVQLFGGSYTNYAGSAWIDAGNPGTSGTNDGKIFMRTNGAETLRLDRNTTANETKILLWDITAGAMVRVSRGASDSGGAGFRVLRIPN